MVFRVIKKFNKILTDHQKLRIFQLAILMIIGGFLETLSVSLVLPFMEAAMDPEAAMEKWYAKALCSLLDIQSTRTFLVAVAIALAGLYIAKNIYLLLEYNIQYRFVYGNMFQMQQKLLNNLLHRPYEDYLKIDSGEIMQIVNRDTAITFSMLSSLLQLFTELIVTVMVIGAIFAVMPGVTIGIGLILLCTMLLINRFIKPVLRKAGISYQKASAEMNKWLLQSIQGIKEVKVTHKERYFEQEYSKHGKIYVTTQRLHNMLGITPRFIIEGVSMGAMFIIMAALIYNRSDFTTTVPMLSVVAMAAIRVLPSVNRISNILATIAHSEPMLDKTVENLSYISGMKKAEGSTSDRAEDRTSDIVHGNIEFHQITYRYPGSEKKVLDHATMDIKRGESVGIVGSSGAGKTTVVDIILGLLVPQEGQVLVDGKDIFDDMAAWYNSIGYIPQSIFMLDDTIRANVAFGEETDAVSDERVWEALRGASLEEYVRSLPEGIETPIGERGLRLSGGEKQRLGIARALYRNPSLLILDEATSALDYETEAEIMKSIHQLRGQKTVIIIAHRLSTLQECDRIYKVENGTIIMER